MIYFFISLAELPYRKLNMILIALCIMNLCQLSQPLRSCSKFPAPNGAQKKLCFLTFFFLYFGLVIPIWLRVVKPTQFPSYAAAHTISKISVPILPPNGSCAPTSGRAWTACSTLYVELTGPKFRFDSFQFNCHTSRQYHQLECVSTQLLSFSSNRNHDILSLNPAARV